MFTRYFCRVDAFWNACTKSQVYVASAAADDSDLNNKDDAVTLLSVLLLLLLFFHIADAAEGVAAPTTNVASNVLGCRPFFDHRHRLCRAQCSV